MPSMPAIRTPNTSPPAARMNYAAARVDAWSQQMSARADRMQQGTLLRGQQMGQQMQQWAEQQSLRNNTRSYDVGNSRAPWATQQGYGLITGENGRVELVWVCPRCGRVYHIR